ncbi:MAG TPA: Glu-tRNA(Gln) amidotransferase subunit GatE [Longimicrobiales bacterium]|nr:Glu-tRNA(Gln) amidotransferase subunit GatE [Longimicrobiales bacterium]
MQADDGRANQSRIRPPGELNPRDDAVLDFPDRSFHEMKPADYAVLGFLSGLEVHQQLLTRSKLFCRCPAGRRTTRVDAEALRHMRPTLSELGEYDGTALMEFKTRKEIVYLLERGSVCTYEMDDTPPFGMDPEAVEIALEIAMLCDLNLVSELHVMRKQYLDGSIPTGFQRTAMVGLEGVVPFRPPGGGTVRELRIRQLSLEEDSCREVSDVGHRITFRTDRLGTPLTEIVTEPELLTPTELQAGARLLADIARVTGRVRRGAGAGRQDVNVSVAGGRRVEIKGVHYHRRLPLLVHNEAFRQLNLLRVRAELLRRGMNPTDLGDPGVGLPWERSSLVADATRLAGHSGYAPLQRAVDRGDTVCAVRLPGFRGILRHPTQPGVTFDRELAERVRVIACPVHAPFLAHSDDVDVVPCSGGWPDVRRLLGAGSDDAVVLVWAPAEDAATAAREILIRAREALAGVPAETRQALPDGTTGFERILPGPDRMYPDTDTPPLPVTDETVERIRARLPESPWLRQARYQRLGLTAAVAGRLAVSGWAELFDAVGPAAGAPAQRLAQALEQRIPGFRRRGGGARHEHDPPAHRIAPLVRALETGDLLPSALKRAVDIVLGNARADAADVARSFRPRAADDPWVEERIRAVAERAGALAGRPREARLRWAMGAAMAATGYTADPVRVRDRLDELIRAASVEAVP